MVATRALRSTRALDADSAALSAGDRALQKKAPAKTTSVETSEKRRGSPNVKARSTPSKNPNKSRSSTSPQTNIGEEEEEGLADDNAEDDDNDDVQAPPSDPNVPVNSIEKSATSALAAQAKSLAGHKIREDCGVNPISVDKKLDACNEVNNSTGHEYAAAEADELSSESSDSEASNFEVADDDDDYGDVDQISNASDDSRQFEAEVEREIFAAGEDGIDWDDENTYHYDRTLNDDIYGFAHESGMSQSLLGLDLFNFDHNLDTRLTQSTPNLQDLGEQIAKFDQAISENMLKLERSIASDSDDSSVTPDKEAKPAGKSKPALKMTTSFEDDGDTTDEDISWTTVSSPGVTLSRENSSLDRRTPQTKKAQRMPRKHRLSLRKIPPHPEKAIAYSIPAPFGSTVRFCTPRTKSYRWMDLRGRGSRNSSGTSSPTMINLEDAYTQGNTRTGAHITDVINGTLFSALHCRGESISELLKDEPPSVSKFYQPLLKSEENSNKSQSERVNKPIEESALALIDFTGCVDDESSSDEDDLMVDDFGPEIHKTPKIRVADCAIDDQELENTTGVPGLRAPMTPPPELDLLMGEDPTSPKKRRMSNRSNGRRSVSPAVKKQRYEGTNEVIV